MNKLKQILTAMAFVLFTGVATMSGNVIAATPDGETPANEGVCDSLQGATPGLYGLCVAYCEAQDLDSFEKEPPRTKILANYNKKKQASDPDMPCMQIPCPCWTDAELASIGADGFAMCNTAAEKIEIINTTLGHARNSADATITVGRERCRYIDFTDPRTIRSFSITPAEAQSCFTQLEQACTGF
jgi:hypothetical protein